MQQGNARGTLRHESGFTLLEVMISLMILAVGTLALVQTIISASMVIRANDEDTMAMTASEQKFAEMMDMARKLGDELTESGFKGEFKHYTHTQYANFKFDTSRKSIADDLHPADPENTMYGTILFPTQGLQPNLQLREDISMGSVGVRDLNGDGKITDYDWKMEQQAALGMPRDLNGDGVVDSLDHKSDYNLLPVTIHMEWVSVLGKSETTVNGRPGPPMRSMDFYTLIVCTDPQ